MPNGDKKDYLKSKTYPDQLPEKLLRDRLATWLGSNPIQKRNDVKLEYAVAGIDGNIDILADTEAWELKVDQADAYDVYQLFMYMDVGEFDKGYLVAADFTSGAKFAAEYISKKHNKVIVLTKFNDFLITHPPNTSEREEDY